MQYHHYFNLALTNKSSKTEEKKGQKCETELLFFLNLKQQLTKKQQKQNTLNTWCVCVCVCVCVCARMCVYVPQII